LTLAGGKGINIARALKRLGVPVVATGLAGGGTGTRIIEELTAEAILNDFVRIDDDSRTSTAIVDPTGGTYTEVNEWGPRVEQHRYRALAPRVDPVSAVGSGDVLLAGFIAARLDGRSDEEALRFAVAAGAASTLELGAGRVEEREAGRLVGGVEVAQLEPVA